MGRRKSLLKVSKKDFKFLKTTLFKQVLGIILLLCGIFGFLSSLFNPQQTDRLKLAVGSLVIGFIGLLIFLATTPVFKGMIGEWKVGNRLKRLAKKYNGFLINDVTIPDEESGKTSQIDHILFTIYGIFVVETKNYSGYIYGNDNQLEWTQVLKYGKEKHKLYNPVKQNATHCYRLKALINNPDLKFNSVIVFVKYNGGEISSSSVVRLNRIRKLIDKFSPILYSQESITEAYNKVLNYKVNPTVTNKEHVQEIKTNLENINNNICPRCGGKLILRISKNGKEFYGCENYPKCSFTKKVK